MQVHTLFNGIANTHVITNAKGVLVVDPGLPLQAGRIARKIRSLGYAPQDVRLVLVTHGHIDHAGSAAALRRLTGAPIAMHPADAPLVATRAVKVPPGRTAFIHSVGRVVEALGWMLPSEPFAPDVSLVDGQSLREFGMEARVVHTPGHTDGSISLAFEDGSVFVGDAILNLVHVAFPLWWQDAKAAAHSACKIQALGPRVCYSGHGRAFDRKQLDAFVDKLEIRRHFG